MCVTFLIIHSYFRNSSNQIFSSAKSDHDIGLPKHLLREATAVQCPETFRRVAGTTDSSTEEPRVVFNVITRTARRTGHVARKQGEYGDG